MPTASHKRALRERALKALEGTTPAAETGSLRLEVEHFRAMARGWQARMNEALRKAAGL